MCQSPTTILDKLPWLTDSAEQRSSAVEAVYSRCFLNNLSGQYGTQLQMAKDLGRTRSGLSHLLSGDPTRSNTPIYTKNRMIERAGGNPAYQHPPEQALELSQIDLIVNETRRHRNHLDSNFPLWSRRTWQDLRMIVDLIKAVITLNQRYVLGKRRSIDKIVRTLRETKPKHVKTAAIVSALDVVAAADYFQGQLPRLNEHVRDARNLLTETVRLAESFRRHFKPRLRDKAFQLEQLVTKASHHFETLHSISPNPISIELVNEIDRDSWRNLRLSLNDIDNAPDVQTLLQRSQPILTRTRSLWRHAYMLATLSLSGKESSR